MADTRPRKLSLWWIAAGVCLFFFVASQAMSWFSMLQRDFGIPIQGKPHLTSHDGWRSETQVLLRDTTTFWRDILAKDGLAYSPPKLVAPLEGPRDACGGPIRTESTAYCPELGQIEFNRIRFNSISRQSKAGMNHLAVAYVFAHLVGHHVQTQLGAGLAPEDLDPPASRRRLELQAECLAGFWLRHGTAEYGEIAPRQLDAMMSRLHMGPDPADVPVPGVLVDFGETPKEARLEWLKRGFRADDLSVCHPFKPAN